MGWFVSFRRLIIVAGIVAALSATYLPYSSALDNAEGAKEAIVKAIAGVLKEQRVALTEGKLRTMAVTIYEEAVSNDVDYRLILAIIKVESNFKPSAVARDGSRGLMQLQPSLAKGIARKQGEAFKDAKELHNPNTNIRYGTYHVAKLIEEHESVQRALHVYNAGVKKARKKLDLDEEPDSPFIRRVLKEYHNYTGLLPEAG
jgi:soluble lytic murein transglycosylase